MFTIQRAVEIYKEEVEKNLWRNFRRVALLSKRAKRNKYLDDMARVLGLTVQEKEEIRLEIVLDFKKTPAFKEIVDEGQLKLGKSPKQMRDDYDSLVI